MDKEKKIGIRYHINTGKKAILRNDKHHYPLYVKIVFNKQSTSIKAYDYQFNDIYLNPNDYEFPNKIEINSLGFIDNSIYLNEQKIQKFIRYEYRLVGRNHTLKRLGHRIELVYSKPIIMIFEPYIVFEQMNLKIAKNFQLSIFEDGRNSLESIYYHLKYYEPNLKSLLSENDKIEFTTYSLLSLFFPKKFNFHNSKIGFDNALSIENWVCGDLKKILSDILNELDYERDIVSKMTPQNKDLLSDFKFDKTKVSLYLKAIDNLILKKIRM